MQFSIGDKIVHPLYGAGQITAMEHRELVKGFEHYYVVQLLAQDSTLYIPVRKMEELGVRAVMSLAKLDHVLDVLQSMPSSLSQDYKERQGRIQEKIVTGRPLRIAEAIRDLNWHRQLKRLTKKDEDLLEKGQDFLASEIAMATDLDIPEAHQMINMALNAALSQELDESEHAQASSAATALA